MRASALVAMGFSSLRKRRWGIDGTSNRLCPVPVRVDDESCIVM